MIEENTTIETVSEAKVASLLTDLKARFRSPIVWLSLALKAVGVLLLMGYLSVTDAEIINQIIGVVAFALTGYSDLNNPQNRAGF